MDNDTALIALVTIVFAGLIWLIKSQQNQSNTVMKDLSKNIAEQNTLSSAQIESLKERDSRDHEFQKNVTASFNKQGKLLTAIIEKADRNYDATIATQNVENQTVEHQTIKG